MVHKIEQNIHLLVESQCVKLHTLLHRNILLISWQKKGWNSHKGSIDGIVASTPYCLKEPPLQLVSFQKN